MLANPFGGKIMPSCGSNEQCSSNEAFSGKDIPN